MLLGNKTLFTVRTIWSTETLCGAEWMVYVVTTEFYRVEKCGGGDVVVVLI
jgi:hypothetical protein